MKKLLVAYAVIFSVVLSAVSKGDDRMVLIPAGVLRGVDPDFGEVCLTNSRAFLMDKTVVTEALWIDVFFDTCETVGVRFLEEGSYGVCPHEARNRPMVAVSFYNAAIWCNARSILEGLTPCYLNQEKLPYSGRDGKKGLKYCDFEATGYRLPTSSEWEYAARAGECTRFPWGDTICFTNANYTGSKENSWDLSGGGLHPVYSKGVNVKALEQGTSPVMSFPPNKFGLYDMIGNVAEWCWPDNKTEVEFTRYSRFILRGGSWRTTPKYLRTGGEYVAHDPWCGVEMVGYWKLLASGFRCVRRAADE